MKCENCGKEFEPRYCLQKYCSRQCKDRQYRLRQTKELPATIKCAVCGKEFEPANYRSKYCSMACRNVVQRERMRDRRYKEIEATMRLARCLSKPETENQPAAENQPKCLHCGKPFKMLKETQKYCSRECFQAAVEQNGVAKPVQEVKPARKSNLNELVRQAAECNLDYGTYSALLRQGKTYEELKAQASQRNPPAAHNRVSTRRSRTEVTFWRLIG